MRGCNQSPGTPPPHLYRPGPDRAGAAPQPADSQGARPCTTAPTPPPTSTPPRGKTAPAARQQVGPCGVHTAPPPPRGALPAIRHRQYLKIRRRNRCHPVFSDEEWTAVQAAASASGLKPGGYAAAVTLAAALSDNPEAAVADIRRLLQELMEADRQVAAIGNNLNQIAHNLWAGGTPPPHLQHVFDRVVQTLDGIDTAAASIIGR
ncbi:MobC family plasmid mobilization relaxosome protein [Kitasatospora aureofaciens]|uniref:MobC family plasmid mobilization relaxosome protein n=1 Tax=Kitasatospora aureofaciens TaxID=1894 RepID=UPI0033E1E510